MDNKSSELRASSEKKQAAATTDLLDGSNTDPLGRRKAKRFRVEALREFPTDCGSGSEPRTVSVESCKKMNVSGDECVPYSEAAVELIPGENMGERRHLKPVDVTTKGAESSHGVNMNLLENTSGVDMTEAVEAQPLSICLPKEDKSAVLGSVYRRRKITAARDFPPNTGSKFSVDGKTVKDAVISMEEKKSDSGDSLGQQPLAESIPVEVELPPSRPSGSSSEGVARQKVKETLRLFYGHCRKILQVEEAKAIKSKGGMFKVATDASNILKREGKYLNTGTRILGHVPGVEVGDEFQYRIELMILGMHRHSQGGIDCMKDEKKELVATSIVASGCYQDELDNSDSFVYTGQGGNVIKKGKINNEPKDQKLVKGNLALANSKDKKTPVRVIRGNQKTASSSGEPKKYVYDGLYLVEEFWKEIGSHGKLVFKYRMRRIPGQPELTWKVLKRTKRSKVREGLCCDDISGGKEKLPICAVNLVDDEKPPQFVYTVKMIYPDWCRPIPPKGCGCTKRCTESRNCACVAKNGGELPYNHDGAIVCAKPMVYECGPNCKCPPNCYLRSSQRGIKLQLEIFKTESRGWGVRSLESIPIGSFICEYAGELLQENEAERLAGKDEYLFDIGNKKQESGNKEHETNGFTIDAARKGNIGRFINHSCMPNLYAQDVLYDHEEERIPHVMLFAQDNIPPLVELSYHYNYKIDQVLDADGNIRKKNCYCGASNCTGRLY